MNSKLRIATIVALVVSLGATSVAFAQADRPEGAFRVWGEISQVVPGQGTFTLITRQGTEITFATSDVTEFKSPEGKIEDIHDLKKGMKALVVGKETDGELPLALLVAARNPDDRPDRFRMAGEITGVDPGQQTLTIKPREGEEVTFQTNDRTQFKSREGSINGLEDLKQGMFAAMVAIKQEEGLPLALLVAAGHPEDRPDRPQVDVRAAGQIVDIANASFTIQQRDGGRMTFGVGDNTKFKSRDGSIQGLDDLEVGMVAAVGAIKNEDGSLSAAWVAAGNPQHDRPNPDRGPNRNPEERPSRPQDGLPQEDVEL